MTRLTLFMTCAVLLSACGISYHSPSVNPVKQSDGKIRVLPINAETVLLANRSQYRPKSLPPVFFQTTSVSGTQRGAGALPSPVGSTQRRPLALDLRVPPPSNPGPYRIGVSDVVLLATPQAGNTLEELSGLLAAQNARQGYTVQDDGSIAIPNVGRVVVAGLTLEEAEDSLFQRLVENQLDPTFSLEIAEFRSKRVSIGGAVQRPAVVPVTLTPVYLDEAIAAAGGLQVPGSDQDFTSIRIYRDGTLYQIPLTEYRANANFRRVQLIDGDSVFIDTEFELTQAQAFFEQEIRVAQLRQSARTTALNELQIEFDVRRASLQDARSNYLARVELGAVDRDYVYLTGEVESQSRFPLPFGQQASLADAIFEGAGGIPTRTGDLRHVYVLRASTDQREFGAVTAWQLDGTQATNFVLATTFELRPNDVIFVAEQPVTRWGRVIDQISPTLIASGVNTTTD